ncbi:hypothetical protein NMG60_11007740 [Bertholletia excelsa]
MHSNPSPLRKTDFDPFQYNKDSDPIYQCAGMKLKMPKPWEHPQEEELKKFKKEFVAWQAARFRECSKVVELGEIPDQWLAQETLNKEKIAFYANSSRTTASGKHTEYKDRAVKSLSSEGCGLLDHTYRKELLPSEQKESHSSKNRLLGKDLHQSPLVNSAQKLDVSSTPTKIVILRPGLEHISDNEESPVSLSGVERDSIEDFLEKVKERLQCELQGKPKKGTMVRGGGIETPFSEQPSCPKQIAQRIAKQVRETVTRDFGKHPLKSESTSSYRREFQYNRSGSLEFINKDSHRLLSDRLRNVLKGETNKHVTRVDYSNSSTIDSEWGRVEKPASDWKNEGKLRSWEIVENESEIQTRYFGNESSHRDLSSVNLVRSMSAPISGTSFGKLLLEDHNILTGAYIWRKHETIEDAPLNVKGRKKERFNLKGKVSSFRHNFTFRGRLFGRKNQLAEQPCNYDLNYLKGTCGQMLPRNSWLSHENSTEVPPSPESACSSVHEQLWEATSHLSTTSPPDVSPLEGDNVHPIFREISSNLNELRRQLSELDTDVPNHTVTKEQPSGAEMEMEDEVKAYIRDLLVASGLYRDTSDKVLSRWDPMAKLISNQTFEQVEESCMKIIKDSEGSKTEQGEKANHKLLFDLLNEALSTVLGPPVPLSKFSNKIVDGSSSQAPNGRKLFDCVWEIINGHLYPSSDITDESIDNMIARDFKAVPWSGLMNDDIDAIGKDMESWITRDLIEELVKDMKPLW